MLFLNEFLQSKQELNLKENTIATYKNSLERFEKWLCELRGAQFLQKSTITEINTATIQKYINELKKSYAKNSVMLHLASIKEFYNYLMFNGIIDSNPAHGVKIPKDATTSKRVHMTLDEGQEILSSVDNVRDRAVMTLGMVLGFRREEIATVELSAFDWDNNTVKFLRKGSKVQTLPIFASAVDAVKAQYDEAMAMGHKYLFQSTHGRKPVSNVTVHNIVKKYSAFSSHENRRLSAKNLISKGVDISTVSKVLNHTSLATTTRYIRIEDSEVMNALRGI